MPSASQAIPWPPSIPAGIERLWEEEDNFQWGGPRLFADGKFATPDGKAHFSCVVPKERRAPEGTFYVSTRRGKQSYAGLKPRMSTKPGAGIWRTGGAFGSPIHTLSRVRIVDK